MFFNDRYVKSNIFTYINFFICICIVFFVSTNKEINMDKRIYIICLYGTLSFLFTSINYIYLYRVLFDYFLIFYIASFMFNGSKMILECLQIELDYDLLHATATNEEILKAYTLVVMALNVLYTTYMILNLKFRKRKVDKVNLKHFKSIGKVGLFLYCISIIPTIDLTLDNLLLYLRSGYASQYQQEVITGLSGIKQILSEFFIPSSLLLYASNDRFLKKIGKNSIYIKAIISLLSGGRATAITSIISLLFLKNYLYKRVDIKKILIMTFIFFGFISPAISLTRNSTQLDKFESIANAENSLFVISLNEMGSSISTVAYTTRLVPSKFDYEYGKSYYYSLLGTVPNFFWDIHPSVKRGTPSKWLVWSIDPVIAKNGGGYGYSYIAEAYLNFGEIGIILIPFIIGIIFILINRAIDNKSLFAITGASIYFNYLILTVRNDSMYLFRPLIWYVFIPYLIFKFFNILKDRRRVYI